MQTVLWEGTRWKTIGLGDLLEPKQVNNHYLIEYCRDGVGRTFSPTFSSVMFCFPCELLQVKLQYRKAMLVVHPDHNVHLTNENRYISKRIFEAVNEAYNEFTTKENV